jgi:hypothetical protein
MTGMTGSFLSTTLITVCLTHSSRRMRILHLGTHVPACLPASAEGRGIAWQHS